jgi:hypothetical protein
MPYICKQSETVTNDCPLINETYIFILKYKLFKPLNLIIAMKALQVENIYHITTI